MSNNTLLAHVINQAAKVTNAGVADNKGLGSACDMGVSAIATPYRALSWQQQIQQSEILYYSDWQAKQIINIPVDDSYRKGWKYKGLTPDEIDRVEDASYRLKIFNTFPQASKLERLHGGSAIVLGLRDYAKDWSAPIEYDQIELNDLRFAHLVKRTEITKFTQQTNPLSSEYGYPQYYMIRGEKIHKSRLILFSGQPIAPVRPYTFYPPSTQYKEDGFNIPFLMIVYSDLLNATKSRQVASHLMERASCFLIKTDLPTLEATFQGNKNQSELERIGRELNIYSSAILTNTPGSETNIETISPNFTAVPELIREYLKVLAGASDIPESRFLGETITGLSSTGKGELENYYNNVAARQNTNLKPNLMKLYRVLLPSCGIDFSDDFDIEFNPLWNENESEAATVRQTNIQNMLGLIDRGVITEEEALEELKARESFLTDPTDVPGVSVQEGYDAPTQEDLTKKIDTLKEFT